MDTSGTERVPLVPGYEVLEPLGRGSSATVWRARRRADGLAVALKVVARRDGDVAAGLREAGLLTAVRHEHVVRLYDVLPLPDPQTGRPAAVALATQLAGGGSLAQVLSRRRRLSPGELVTALQPVAGALADLHARGMVHGDLSTGNVLFTGDGMPLLSDLGAARVAGSTHAELLGTGADEGLVAPEVVEGFPATRESDVYQLGAISWLALAGEPPGPGWSRGDLDELAPGLPPGLADLVTRCLEPEPGDRPDAEELALALLATVAPEPVEVAPDADPGHGLTERLRQRARDEVSGADGARPPRRWGWLRGWVPASRAPGSHREPAPSRPPGRAVLGAGVRAAAWPALAALVLVGALGAARLAGVDVLGLLPDGSPVAGAADGEARTTPASTTDLAAGTATTVSPEDVADQEASGSATGAPPTTEVSPTTGADDGAAPDHDEGLVGTLQALVDGRALAWEAADPDLLVEVAAEGSPALASEAEALDRARDQGLRYEDVSFRVEEAAVVTEDDERVTVDAEVTRAPLRGTDGQGGQVVSEPESTEHVRLVLARAGAAGEWLLWSWAPQDESSTR